MNESEVFQSARSVGESLAGKGLSPAFAKLYSHHTRLSAEQIGLAGWRSDEAYYRLHDAMRLIGIAFLEKDSGIEAWQTALRRAGELLEWLSHSETNPEGLPIRLLASATYQLAGYPARALGLLNQAVLFNGQSRILYFLLRADFHSLFHEIGQYWRLQFQQSNQLEQAITWEDQGAYNRQFQQWIADETIRALGILCTTFRWGDDESRLDDAINKLDAVAKVMLHGKDPYSWLLAKLCAEVVKVYVQSSLRSSLSGVIKNMDTDGSQIIERYLRQTYKHSRALAWPSQLRGIAGIETQNSFALCTPTGSGKTTVAEIAILQSLFSKNAQPNGDSPFNPSQNNMVVYLVPSKALASEIESHLTNVVNRIRLTRIVVSCLYGGTDWGPTDAWLTSDERVVLICTYEKAEALIRFLGPMFLDRISLVVIDEAHSVQFDDNLQNLYQAESRPLRVEVLSSRLIQKLHERNRPIIALSAVASGYEVPLANWVSGESNSQPVKTKYRSTRQLLGRLECLANRGFEIRLDQLDGENLQFQDGPTNSSPFIPNPFPPHPPAFEWREKSAEIQMRPHLLWAAMHLAAPDSDGNSRGVLISVPSNISGHAEDFLKLLDSTWQDITLPKFFAEPTEPLKIGIWQQTLKSCADYFTEDSREYRLLQKGIIVHHGKMPGLLARLLVQTIQEKIVSLVIATSTLSEGVNLPFETILVPSLQRYKENRQQPISAREFTNLIGRAGRPGFGTEGRSLVLLPDLNSADADKKREQVQKTRNRYFELIAEINRSKSNGSSTLNAISPLAELLRLIQQKWERLAGSKNRDDFLHWLEQVAPIEFNFTNLNEVEKVIVEAVDSLDTIILSSIVELEEVSESPLSENELEELLKKVWQNTYAHYASQHELLLSDLFVRRGRVLYNRVYPHRDFRRKLYRTSLPPRTANQLILLSTEMRNHLKTGVDYADWSEEKRLAFIQETIELLGGVERFQPKDKTRQTRSGQVNVLFSWQDILRWWLSPTIAKVSPTYKQISDWHSYISSTFQYRVNWGLGSMISLLIEEEYGGLPVVMPTLEDWSLTGLPWAAFWMKDLIVWGTLEPVAAYLLSRRMEIARPDAEKAALTYYDSQNFTSVDEKLNAISIKRWADSRYSISVQSSTVSPPHQIEARLLRDFSNVSQTFWRVIPVENGEKILWTDPAGYPLATSYKPEDWDSVFFDNYDFKLNVDRQMIITESY